MPPLRDALACGWLALMLFCAWFLAIGRLCFEQRFWDPAHSLRVLAAGDATEDAIFFGSQSLKGVATAYFTAKYSIFAPHVASAILWWHGSLLQLIPTLRRAWGGAIHRWNGRMQMIAVFIQVATGVGLSLRSHSPTITLVGLITGVMFAYLGYYTWLYAWRRDIERHRFWATKLLGYSQVIGAQRFFMILLVGSLHAGVPLYPDLRGGATVEQADAVIMAIFDDSFTLAAIVAPLLTEWYQSGQVDDMMTALRGLRGRSKTA